METNTGKKPAVKTVAAWSILALGIMLLVYCITVEDEPGGVSLLLILGSIVWLIAQRIQTRLRKPAKL